VWVANARIRREREEAVDEAVMLALDADAEIYAPTLLEVARLAFRRPLMSLGLVGIMESRSALRQRIERLLAFRAPRKAGMTLASLCGICIFSAVALPMGEGPAPVEKEMAADASPPLRGMSEVSMAATTLATVPRTNPPSVLVTAEIYEMSGENCKNLLSTMPINPGNQGKANESAWWPVAKDEFSKLLNDLKHSGLAPVQRPRVLTSSGKAADFFVGHDTHGTELDCLPVVNGGQVDLAVQFETMDLSARVPVMNRFKVNALMENQSGVVIRVPNDLSNSVVFLNVEILTNRPSVSFQPRLPPVAQPRPADAAFNPPVYTGFNPPVYTGPGRQAIMAKLGKIRLGNVFYDSLPLNEVLKQLSHECKLLDPEGKGINFLINNHPDHSSQPGAAGTTAGGGVAANEAADPGSVIVKIPSLTDVRLADVLDAIVLVADHPIKYSVQDFAVVFSAKNSATPPLSTRTFRADPNTFYSGLESVSAQSFGAIQNSGSAGGGGGQNQNNGAVVGAVNAFGGTSGGGQGSESLLNNPGANLAGDGGSAQAASAAASARQTAVTFRLNYPKPEAELKTLLSEAGVKMPPATLVCNAKAGLFLVRGTPDQLVLANRLVLKLNGYTPQEIQSYDGGFAKSMNKVPVVADESTNLFMRTFRVDPNTFYSGLINASGPGFQNAQTNGGVKLPYVTTQTSTSTPSALARACFSSLGVNLTNPPGKSVFFSDRTGELFVKATKSDLDTIERALAVLNQIPPQIHIKARFYEVPSGTLKDFGKYLNAINPIDGKPMGILTFQNANAARQALQSRKSVKVLAEPEITMLSGRQAQMRATEMVTVVTNTLFESLRTNQFGELEHNVVTPEWRLDSA
jgi:type II secretory pathway component GspD/PulD (secretin)